MALAPGSRLGVYEVVAPLGAGGMGEVYRAKDTRLGRAVALKTLPPEFALDADRRARFEREAKTLATLNHPHIAQIYGLEEVPGADGAPPTLALAMELVEGEDLAERISRGPVPLDEALPLARQIAEGLEAAHEAGIVHRDLKPANIRVTPEGVVKVLDFGLAKPTEPVAASVLATHSPTLTSPALTTRGVVLGTASYMAPEQAKGKPVDRRADIWAFGCVLYELLTGRRAFEGEDVPEILGAIIKTEPDWTTLPSSTPRHVRTLLVRCLAKDRTLRLQHIGDARLELASALTEHGPTEISIGKRPASRLAWIVAGLAMVVAVALAAALVRPQPDARMPITSFAVPLPPDVAFTNLGRHVLALSPDGATLVFVANLRLYRRDLATNEVEAVPGTESRRGVMEPTFSPDGQWVAYYSNDEAAIKRIRPDGSGAQVLCQAQVVFGLSWGRNGILFAERDKGIFRCPNEGGDPSLVVSVTAPKVAASPHEMPGTSAIAYSLAEGEDFDRWERGSVVVHDEATAQQHVLLPSATDSRIAGRHVIYRQGTTMFAVALGVDGASTSGAPVALVRGLRIPTAPDVNPPTGHVAASATGVLAYLIGNEVDEGDRVLAMVDGKGAIKPLAMPAGEYSSPRVSPDGRYVAYVAGATSQASIWIHEVSGTGSPRRLTFDGANRFPVWSSDGAWIYHERRGATRGLFRQRANGSAAAELVLRAATSTGPSTYYPEAALPDGTAILFSEGRQGGRFSLRALSTRDGTVSSVVDADSAAALEASVSRDGRWLAYSVSNGRTTTSFVEPMPPTGAKYELPYRTEAGKPMWWSDGRSLVYQDFSTLLRLEALAGNAVQFGSPSTLERGPLYLGTASSRRNIDAIPSSDWFIGVVPATLKRNQLEGGDRQVEVVVNWQELLRPRATAP